MDKEYFIVKRISYDYGSLPEYLTEHGFSRDIRKVKIFNTVIDASNAKRLYYDTDYDYFIDRM